MQRFIGRINSSNDTIQSLIVSILNNKNRNHAYRIKKEKKKERKNPWRKELMKKKEYRKKERQKERKKKERKKKCHHFPPTPPYAQEFDTTAQK